MTKFLLLCSTALLVFCFSLTAQNIVSEELLFTDSDTLLLTTNKRAFYANKMVDAHVNYPYATGTTPESVGDGVYRVLNIVPAEFSDLYVYAKLSGIEETILVDKFSLVKAFTSTIVELPFVNGEKEFETHDGGTVTVTDSKNKLESMWTECDDPVFQKLQSIKQTTYYQFVQNVITDNDWAVMTPQVARHFTTSVANISYMWSQPFFEEMVTEYSGVLYGDDAQPIDPKVDLLDRILSHDRINFCPTTSVAGFGGGTTLGIHTSHFISATYEKAKFAPDPFQANESGLSTWAHEWSHCVGYSHDSNTTYGTVEGSWIDISSIAFDVLSTDNDEVSGIMYKDGVARTVTNTLPFLYNVYVQELTYAESIDLGDINSESYSTASIQLENNSYNNGADLIIDEVVCPEGLFYDGDYPIVIASSKSASIPLTVSIDAPANVVVDYNEVVVLKAQNTANIVVTATVTPDLSPRFTPSSVDASDIAEMSVYPNPSTGIVFISADYDRVEVYDINGKYVYTQSAYTSSIDLTTLPNGVYFVNVTKDDVSYMERIIIQ